MTFQCPQCGQQLELQDTYAGEVVACPACSTHIMAPCSQPTQPPAGCDGVSPDIQAMKQSLQSGIDRGQVTLSRLMADQQAGGDIPLDSSLLGSTGATEVSDVLTVQPEMKYVIGTLIAKGRTQAVINAADVNLRRNVAMKVMLSPETASNARFMRFIKEAQITGQLEHPGIVPLHELGMYDENNIFYTMKHVRGCTLKDVLLKLRAGDRETIAGYQLSHLLTVFQKVCDAVAFAHSRNVLHLDLKPENIMFGDFGEVLVMDWGLAKILPRKQKRDETDEQLIKAMDEACAGTPEFMAPEQAMGKANKLDRRTDIYSLGAILHNMLTLEPPSQKTGKRRHSFRRITLWHLPDRKVPKSLEAICTKALQPDHAKRYQTVKELQKDVEAYQRGFATAAENAGFRRQVQLFIMRHRTITSLAASIILFATIAGIGSTTQWMRARTATAAAIQEKQAAAKALSTLKDCAPDMVELYMMFLERGQIDNALKRISYATELAPNNAEYFYLKGNALQTLLQLDAANHAYNQALQLDPTHKLARENRQLCSKIKSINTGLTLLPNSVIGELYAAIRAQGRFCEATALAQWLIRNSGTVTVDAIIRTTLDEAGIKHAFAGIDTNNNCQLNLASTLISDLTPLRGLPLTHLGLYATRVRDLSPLKGMPLTALDITTTGISDLSPLRGMPLTILRADNNGIVDLSPLKDANLKYVSLSLNRIRDITVLTGMPVEELDLKSNGFEDFASLHKMPLRRLSINGINDLSLLSGLKLTHLNLRGNQCTDISPLKDLPLESLCLDLTPVSDLSPLKGMALKELSISNAPVRDLSPLNDVPLTRLLVDKTKLKLMHQIKNIRSAPVVIGLDIYQPLLQCNESIASGNHAQARRLATEIISEWSTTPMMSNLCNTAKWVIDELIPFAEAPDKTPPGIQAPWGHHFCVMPTAVKWHDAQRFCENLGAHLATPANKEEWDWLLQAFPGTAVAWLGGTRPVGTDEWKWISGRTWDFCDWGEGQPDKTGKENALLAYRGKFYDLTVESAYAFIMEWDR